MIRSLIHFYDSDPIGDRIAGPTVPCYSTVSLYSVTWKVISLTVSFTESETESVLKWNTDKWELIITLVIIPVS